MQPYQGCNGAKVPCDYGAVTGWTSTLATASSRHPGGVNVGLLDGSVRFVGETINNAVWQAAGSIDGGGREFPEETSPEF
jgi:prepilin-type processing-associated H-X9-DG protein